LTVFLTCCKPRFVDPTIHERDRLVNLLRHGFCNGPFITLATFKHTHNLQKQSSDVCV
jgi:hypothetical protein